MLRLSPFRLALVLLLAVAALSVRPALADDYGITAGTRNVMRSCQSELTKYCSRSSAGLHQMSGCLRGYYINLSLVCRNALKSASAQGTGTTSSSDTTSLSP
jgi:hypothetical protein